MPLEVGWQREESARGSRKWIQDLQGQCLPEEVIAAVVLNRCKTTLVNCDAAREGVVNTRVLDVLTINITAVELSNKIDEGHVC